SPRLFPDARCAREKIRRGSRRWRARSAPADRLLESPCLRTLSPRQNPWSGAGTWWYPFRSAAVLDKRIQEQPWLPRNFLINPKGNFRFCRRGLRRLDTARTRPLLSPTEEQ